MPARVCTYLLDTLPSAGVLGIFLPGQHVPNLLVLNNYSKPSSLAHAYVLGSRSYSKTALLEYLYAHKRVLDVPGKLADLSVQHNYTGLKLGCGTAQKE